MLDIKFVRANPDAVKENIKKKFQDEKIPMVDEVIEFDAKYRAAKTRCDELRAQRNKKSKELLALLVDRKGGYITSEEAISFLWEDEPANTLTLSRYRKVALRLKSTLEEYGITDIVEVIDGKRRIVMEKVACDLYNYLSGKEEYSQLFKGSYLTNYSWGETTLGELMNEEK